LYRERIWKCFYRKCTAKKLASSSRQTGFVVSIATQEGIHIVKDRTIREAFYLD